MLGLIARRNAGWIIRQMRVRVRAGQFAISDRQLGPHQCFEAKVGFRIGSHGNLVSCIVDKAGRVLVYCPTRWEKEQRAVRPWMPLLRRWQARRIWRAAISKAARGSLNDVPVVFFGDDRRADAEKES